MNPTATTALKKETKSDMYEIDMYEEPQDVVQTDFNLRKCITFMYGQDDIEYPVTLVREDLINCIDIQIPEQEWNRYCGIPNFK